MRIYFMRHGPAEDVADTGRDFDRALTPAGRTRVRGVAELLAGAGEAPLRVLTSPLLRAIETAEIVARVCGLPTPGLAEPLTAGRDARALVDALMRDETDDARVMLVGHEPDLTHLEEHAFLGEGSLAGFDKAEVRVLWASGKARRLELSVDPRELRFR